MREGMGILNHKIVGDEYFHRGEMRILIW
jgi:hypothetical protein